MAGAALEPGWRMGGDPMRNQMESLVGQERTLKNRSKCSCLWRPQLIYIEGEITHKILTASMHFGNLPKAQNGRIIY